ncbi:MAG: SUF system Fe-S cluster assembly regulator [Rickettsiales bacterium]|jgi:FeS assembly SUF system regulator|nr:SUF system Fe-S cluster assembly regulator [Rickettsiales bacterium]
MIRISRLADYGVVLMCEISSSQGRAHSAHSLSKKTNMSESAIMKILKLLVTSGLLDSMRGPKGGYFTIKDPKDINVLDIISAIDGPVSVTICSNDSHETCEFKASCVAKHGWGGINKALQATLSGFTIANFITSNAQSKFSASD